MSQDQADRARQDFVAWIEKNLPPGTVIGDPAWWALRIWRRALEARDAAAPPPGEESTKARSLLLGVESWFLPTEPADGQLLVDIAHAGLEALRATVECHAVQDPSDPLAWDITSVDDPDDRIMLAWAVDILERGGEITRGKRRQHNIVRFVLEPGDTER